MPKPARTKSPIEVPADEIQPQITAIPAQPAEEEIALRAYQIYLERTGAGGSPEDDWFQAERELQNLEP